MTPTVGSGDTSGQDDTTHGVQDMGTIELDELFGFAEDPEFRQARAQGHAAFAEAVREMATRPLTGPWVSRKAVDPTRARPRGRGCASLPSTGTFGRAGVAADG
jgi:hypothetical protein